MTGLNREDYKKARDSLSAVSYTHLVGASGETEKEMNIYNPQIECMDRESMRALQLERLKKTVRYLSLIHI